MVLGKTMHAVSGELDAGFLEQLERLCDLLVARLGVEVLAVELGIVQPHPLDVSNGLDGVEVPQRIALHAERESPKRIFRHIQPRSRQDAGNIKKRRPSSGCGGESEETAAGEGEGHGENSREEMVRSFYAVGLAMRVGIAASGKGIMGVASPEFPISKVLP